MKISHFSLIITVFLCFTAAAALCPQGDLNGDCRVDFVDIKAFAEQWLDVGGCSHSGCADFDSIDGINLADYSVLAAYWLDTGIPLVINEFMASNSSDINDPQGDFDDWVEIYNFGEIAIDMNGMYLTDNFGNPTKWQIPQSIIVDANGFVIFWADEDIGDGPMHADFKLSASGEEIGLFLDAGTMIDGIVFGDQTTDISYGRYPDANDELRFFSTPTPLADNNGAYIDFVEKVEFSHERGFYESSFDVTMATETEGVDIYYTTDGSEPIQNEAPSASSTEYTGAVTVSSNACLRAAAIKTGWMPSRTITHTYVFNADGVGGYDINDMKSMPVYSLVGDPDTAFWGEDGIMQQPEFQYRGVEYERPVSFEIIDAQTGLNCQVNCGTRIAGSDYHRKAYTVGDNWHGWAYNYNKISLKLYFRSIYGDNELDYPAFPLVDTDKFKTMQLRGGHNDSYNPFIKDEWYRRLNKDMGGVASIGTAANFFLNGQFKAYFNPCQRYDEDFFRDYYNVDTDWDVLTHRYFWSRNLIDIRDGDDVAILATESFFNSNDMSIPANYAQAGEMVDIINLIDYIIIEQYSGNTDWPGNNYTLSRERTPEGKWRFHCWDMELPPVPIASDGINGVGGSGGFELFYSKLRASSEFNLLFADRLQKHFFGDGALTQANLIKRFTELEQQMSQVLSVDPQILNDFIPGRTQYLLDYYTSEGLFPSFDAPVFNVNGGGQHGGYVTSSDTITITDPCSAGTIYYTLDGSDPRQPGESSSPNTTVLVSDDDSKKAFVPTSDIGTDWRGGNEPYNESGWTSGTSGVGYERDEDNDYDPYIGINVEADMYGNNGTCYIRIPFTVDGGELSSYEDLTLKVRYDDGFVAYINGTEVERVNAPTTPLWDSTSTGSHEASSSWDSYDISAHIGELDSGDNILAIHGLNTSDGSTDFLISAELEASYGGGSTEPNISPSAIEYTGGFNLDKSTHLKARVYKSSTTEWSALNEAIYDLGEAIGNVRITEIMYHPQDTNNPNDPNEEYIELKNIGGSSINLNLVRFTNGIDFVFGPNELAAGEYILVVKDINAFEAEYGTGKPIAGQYTGSLANNGERIELEDSMGTNILNFNYSDGWRSITDGDGYSLTIINPANADVNSWDEKDSWRPSAYINGSPGWDDSGIVPNPGDIVINEIMSHSHGGDPDWIEIYNNSAGSIDIGGWYLSDDESNIAKYEFGTGTVIDGNSYLVVSEDVNFGASASDPGKHIPFALSENGEVVCLTSAMDANSDPNSAASCIGHWKMNDNTVNTDVLDDSGNDYNGSFNDASGNPSTSAHNIVGKINGALDFDGIDDYVVVPDDVNLDIPGALTLAFWTKYTSSSSGWIISKGTTGGAYGYWAAVNAGQIRFGDNAGFKTTTASTYNDGAWHFVVCVYDGGSSFDSLKIYVDNVEQTTTQAGSFSGFDATNEPLVLGGHFDSGSIHIGRFFAGSIDNVMVVDEALTQEEISYLYNSGNGTETTPSLDINSVLTGYRQKEDFGASETGISFGRYYKSSTNNFNFVAMEYDTPELANAYPKVGPIVINEIMYNPDWPDGGSYENDQYEYIELYNNSSGPVTLYDYAQGEPWKFTDGIDYTFPASPNEVTIAAGESILVVKNLAAFSWRYTVPSGKVFGPYDGKLSNGGEKVQLGKPGDEDGGIRYYIRVDRVDYSDGLHPQDNPGNVDLWPTGPDGNGSSLDLIDADLYGNDPNNWQAATPTPGS